MDYAIGEASRLTGIKVPTIRYYEGIGLLSAPARTEGRQRRYRQEDVARLNFIRHARDLGFEIADIAELLALSEAARGSGFRAYLHQVLTLYPFMMNGADR